MLIDVLEMNWRIAWIIIGTIVLYILLDGLGKRAWITALTQRSYRIGQTIAVTTEMSQRIETISSIFTKTSKIALIAVAVAMILAEVGVNIIPIITGAGIIGVAVGLGAQSLIKDMLAGMFIIIENQYSKGDEVSLGEVRGKVIHFSLRTTVLRDEANVEHFLPNGSVTHVANFSKYKVKN